MALSEMTRRNFASLLGASVSALQVPWLSPAWSATPRIGDRLAAAYPYIHDWFDKDQRRYLSGEWLSQRDDDNWVWWVQPDELE